jgi:uridine kinase
MSTPNNQLKSELLATIDRAAPPHGMSTKIVAVDGGGGAGKTTLAKHLSEWVGGAPIITMDDFAHWGIALLDRWPRLLEQVLEPLGRNQPAHYQRYDWKKLGLAEWHDVAPGGTIILEGVASLQHEFRPYLSYRIWVEAPKELRLKRGVARNRGIEGEDNHERWLKWQVAEDEYFDRDQPQAAADLIVDATAEPYQYHFTAKDSQK